MSWFDTPNPNPKRRKPMEQLLAEFAERTGSPLMEVKPADGGRNAHRRAS